MRRSGGKFAAVARRGHEPQQAEAALVAATAQGQHAAGQLAGPVDDDPALEQVLVDDPLEQQADHPAQGDRHQAGHEQGAPVELQRRQDVESQGAERHPGGDRHDHTDRQAGPARTLAGGVQPDREHRKDRAGGEQDRRGEQAGRRQVARLDVEQRGDEVRGKHEQRRLDGHEQDHRDPDMEMEQADRHPTPALIGVPRSVP